MAAFCIPKELAAKLKEAARTGEITVAKLYEATSQERRDLFAKYVDENTAREINTGFENALAKEDLAAQKQSLKAWAERTFTGSEKKTGRYKDVIQKINDLDKLGVLTPEAQKSFLEDLVAEKLGITVTAEEAKQISTLSKKLESLAADTSEFGTPTIEYFKARKEMDDYIDSLTPNSNLRVLSETIGRGTLLASLKSPLLNIESNTVQGVNQAFARRLQTRRLGGKNNALAFKYMQFAIKVFNETGFDITRMQGLEGDRQIRGEEKPNTQGAGKIRALGRMYEDVIFKKTQGLPDVVYASAAFADRANIESTKIAQAQKLTGSELKAKAQAIFKDATSITPQTKEGKAVRASAMADAMYTTYTNKSVYADFALGIRKLFNIPSKDFRVGDQIMPFVKTPANVIGAGVDSSGILLPVDVVVRMAKTIKAIRAGKGAEEIKSENWQNFTHKVVTAGLGITFAWLLSNLFKPEDYIGEYPTTSKEKSLLDLNVATPNSVKIGGKWVSLDYFGPLGAPLVGFLYAKKYGTDLPDTVWQYYKGVGRQIAKIPGFDEFYNTVDTLKQSAPGQDKKLSDEVRDITNYAVSFVRARIIPSLVSDIAKGTDTSERKTDYQDATSGIRSGLPGFRETLPEKKNVFGDVIKTEPFLSVLFFGSRVKTASKDPVVDELNRLSQAGYLPSITDVSRTSTRVKELKNQISEGRFNSAMEQFGRRLHTAIDTKIRSGTYQQADDEKKQSIINTIKDNELNLMLKRNGYRKPKKK